MKEKLLALVFLSGIAFLGCSRQDKTVELQFDNSEVLCITNHQNIFYETWHRNELFGQPIYMICEQKNGETNREILFTIETEFQESVPGRPQFFVKDGEAFIRDATTSYVYSVKSRQFITNTWLADVYEGSFMNSPSSASKH